RSEPRNERAHGTTPWSRPSRELPASLPELSGHPAAPPLAAALDAARHVRGADHRHRVRFRDPGKLHRRLQWADVRLRLDGARGLHGVCGRNPRGAEGVSVVRRPTFIARQAGRPSGLFGRALGAIMAIETRSLNDEVLRRLAVAPGERILEI